MIDELLLHRPEVTSHRFFSHAWISVRDGGGDLPMRCRVARLIIDAVCRLSAVSPFAVGRHMHNGVKNRKEHWISRGHRDATMKCSVCFFVSERFFRAPAGLCRLEQLLEIRLRSA
jgi:hypothetical protein